MKLIDNPFYILKCLPESSKEKIIEQAEQRSFDIDEQLCINAKNILLNPQKRLEAEIFWFLGLTNEEIIKKISKMSNNMQNYISDFIFEKTDFHLAEANLLVYGLENEKNPTHWSEDNIRLAAHFLCVLSEKINIEQTKKLIDKSRQIAKIPSNISDEELLFQIDNLKNFYKTQLYVFLKKIDKDLLVSIFTKMVDSATNSGKENCKYSLLEQLVYNYELDSKNDFEKQKLEISKVAETITNIDLSKNKLPEEYFSLLENEIKKWNMIIKPVMMLKMSRGIDDEYSISVFYTIRALCITISNKYNDYQLSYRITKLLCKPYFSDLREANDVINKDSMLLEGLIQQKLEAKLKN